MIKINSFDFKKIDEMTGREVYCIERLRNTTFVAEQKITLPDLDDEDLIATQVYVLNQKQTTALVTCRLFQEDGKWMLGRVAVAKEARGMHLGSQMLEAVHQFLQADHVAALYCHAQMRVKPFYDKLGYQVIGEPFDEGGVEQVMMKKIIIQ